MGEWSTAAQRPRHPRDSGQSWPAEGSSGPAGTERVQRAAEPGQSAVPPEQGAQQPEEHRPTAEQVADRVYELLLQDLRLENERLGR